MKALTELFIGAVLAVIDSVTEVGYKSLTELAGEAVTPEDALGLVVTQPVSRRTEQGLVPRVPGGLTWLRPVKEEVRDGSVLVRLTRECSPRGSRTTPGSQSPPLPSPPGN